MSQKWYEMGKTKFCEEKNFIRASAFMGRLKNFWVKKCRGDGFLPPSPLALIGLTSESEASAYLFTQCGIIITIISDASLKIINSYLEISDFEMYIFVLWFHVKSRLIKNKEYLIRDLADMNPVLETLKWILPELDSTGIFTGNFTGIRNIQLKS